MKSLKNLVFIAFLFILTLSVSCSTDTKSTEVKVVTTEEMQALLEMEDVQLVDVRSAQEYDAGFIKGAQNIDIRSSTFEEDIQKLDKNKPVILYCKGGGRSAKCAKKMEEAGFILIYDLDGGISQWQFEGLEVETIK